MNFSSNESRIAPWRFWAIALVFLAGCTRGAAPDQQGAKKYTHPGTETGSDDSKIWAGSQWIDTLSGKVVWDGREIIGKGGPALGIGDRIVFVAEDTSVECLNWKEETRKWKSEPLGRSDLYWGEGHGWPWLLQAGSLVLQVASSRLRAFDVVSGLEVWSVSLTSWLLGYWRRDIVFGWDAFLLLGECATVCFDLSTGRPLWHADSRASAVPLDDGSFCLVTATHFEKRRARDGASLWRVEAPTQRERDCALRSGRYLVTGSSWYSETSKTECIDETSGRVHWTCEDERPLSAISSKDASTVFIVLKKGRGTPYPQSVELLALDTRTWKARWQARCEDWTNTVALELVEDRLILEEHSISALIGLKCVDPASGQTLWRAPVCGFDVAHSMYHQFVRLVCRDAYVTVVSNASAGSFVETFNVGDGSPVSRWALKRW